jgi:hypothetical protein
VKKILLPILVLALAIGLAIPMATPVAANTTTFVSLTPAIAVNVVGDEHTVTATITPAEAGVPITFKVTGANSALGVVDTKVNGTAEFSYIGTNVGVDTIAAFIDYNNDGEWFEDEPIIRATNQWVPAVAEHFVTGGGIIKTVNTAKKGNPVERIIWSFGGTVGYRKDGSIKGQFQIVDHSNNKTWHCHNLFDSLEFSGEPTDSPPASLDTAVFTGTFTNNKGDAMYLRVTLWDDQEPGKGFDEIEVEYWDGSHWQPWFSGQPISGGTFQVHEGTRG